MREQLFIFRRLWGYSRTERARVVAALALGSLASAAAIGLIATAAYLISKASLQPPILTLTAAIVGVRFFGISRGVARYCERLVGHDATFGILTTLRVEVYRRLEELAPSRVPFYRSGDLFSRFVADVDSVQQLFLRVIPPYVIAVVVGSGTAVFIALLAPWAGLIAALGLIGGALVVPWLAVRASKHAENERADQEAAVSTATLQVLDALPELVAAGTAAPRRDHVFDAQRTLRLREERVSRSSGTGSGLAGLIAGLTVVGCFVAGSVAVAGGRLDGVLLAVVVLTPLAAFDLVLPLPAAYQQWLDVRSSAIRLFALLDEEPAIEEPHRPRPVPIPPVPIQFDGVSARWPNATELVLHDITLAVGPQERVAVVGPSGSGKSTMAALLVRFLDVDGGVIQWHGEDVASFDSDDARRCVGLLTQDSHVFDTTIEENLRIARRDATSDELEGALERARLLAWVKNLPQGLDTPVGEHGARLSGGQRQRLCLARLLLARFPVVVLDEPAEHLDLVTADQLMTDLLTVTVGVTTLVITHRLKGLQAVDRIMVMTNGRITEQGTHSELLETGGWYAKAWQLEQGDLEQGDLAQ